MGSQDSVRHLAVRFHGGNVNTEKRCEPSEPKWATDRDCAVSVNRTETPSEEAARWTSLHSARSPADATKMDALRPAAAAFIQTILTLCPSNADRSAAVRSARLALMQAVASVVVPQ